MPYWIIQAYGTIINADLFHKAHQLNLIPVFNIHDSVITKIEPELQVVNDIVKNSLQKIINKLKLEWIIPEDTFLVKVRKIDSKPTNLKKYREDTQLDKARIRRREEKGDRIKRKRIEVYRGINSVRIWEKRDTG